MQLFDRAHLYIVFDVYIKTHQYKYVKVKSSNDYTYICARSTEATRTHKFHVNWNAHGESI